MPRRKSAIDAGTMGLLIVVGILWAVGTAIANALKSPDGWVLIAIVAGVIVLIIVQKAAAKKKRLEYLQYLMGKYGDATIVDHICNHRFWQGQTAEQLIDSLGPPHGVDKKLLKSINREVWKYNPRGVNRYGLRITLDNYIVTTWDQKQ
jgi:hypothetical protein